MLAVIVLGNSFSRVLTALYDIKSKIKPGVVRTADSTAFVDIVTMEPSLTISTLQAGLPKLI